MRHLFCNRTHTAFFTKNSAKTNAPLAITFNDHWHVVAFAAGENRAKFLNTTRKGHTFASSPGTPQKNRRTASDHLSRSLAHGGVCRGPRSCQVLEHKTQLPYISNICGYSTNEALHAEWHARLHMPCNLHTQDFTTPSQSLPMMDK